MDAVDRQENMVEITMARAEQAGLANVEGLVAEAHRLPLEDASVDAILMSMMFHDITNKEEALEEARRVLKPGGMLCLVEMDRTSTASGPPIHLRIGPEQLTAMLRYADFTPETVQPENVRQDFYFVRATKASHL